MEETNDLEQIIEELTSKIKQDYYNTSYLPKILNTSFTSYRGELREYNLQVGIPPLDNSIITSGHYHYEAFFKNLGFDIAQKELRLLLHKIEENYNPERMNELSLESIQTIVPENEPIFIIAPRKLKSILARSWYDWGLRQVPNSPNYQLLNIFPNPTVIPTKLLKTNIIIINPSYGTALYYALDRNPQERLRIRYDLSGFQIRYVAEVFVKIQIVEDLNTPIYEVENKFS